jgi:hypothetical protein
VTPKPVPGLLPLAPALCLAALALFAEAPASRAFLIAAAVLLMWNATLLLRTRTSARVLRLEFALRKQHYIQACVQGSILAIWGWYWPPVYAHVPYLAAQLLFAYAFDMLLAWSRRETYTLGFGVFPVIFSINLFLWFRPDWFYLQFALVALGFAAKEFLRWERDGRSAHIFNPSSFPLAIVSLALLLTGATGITRGPEIATTQFYPPHMFLVLFLLALPGQFFFGVTSMTLSAVLTTYAFGQLYFAATGIYFFYDSYIPISVFLGMHFLFTDPATAPRSLPGRILFGMFYGGSTIALYQLLGSFGLPTFYDKLLQVPFMNLSVRALDRAAQSKYLRWLNPFALTGLKQYQRHLAYIATWAVVFTSLSAAGAVGDNHPGQFLPFWRQACQDGRAYACPYLADLDLTHCNAGSGWACNEAGLMHIALARSGEDLRRRNLTDAAVPLARGCDLGFAPACANRTELLSGSNNFAAPAPSLADFPILLRGSKGEITERDPASLQARACRQGWPNTCVSQ